MGEHNLQFAALVGSRICHDLISPIGAINNGMELMSMSGIAVSPEMALISESVDAANARIRFFRIAYGAPSNTQLLGRTEITSILKDMSRGARLKLHWDPVEDLSRSEVQLAFLAIQCAEQAMPYGGTLTVQRSAQRWNLEMDGERFALDGAHWQELLHPSESDEEKQIQPAHVQFLLLPLYASALGRRAQLTQTESGAIISV